MICAKSFVDISSITSHIKTEHEEIDFSGQEKTKNYQKFSFFSLTWKNMLSVIFVRKVSL